jgi:hypothetical protein
MAEQHAWIELLKDEDLAFLKRFVLASGSLKELAQAYGISYPTVRLRLDRLIAKVQVFDSQRKMPPFERSVRALHADGRVDLPTMKAILEAYKRDANERDAQSRNVQTRDAEVHHDEASAAGNPGRGRPSGAGAG